MSLRPEAISPIPEQTIRVARAAFPKGNLYLKMRDELGTFYKDADFISLFSSRGQSAYSPWRLALITVMQFAEGLSDRQAAEAVRARIDWKYALSLELTDTGFDFSILSEFRSRLVQKGEESILLEKMLDCFREKQLLKARGKQRTDSTHIVASVRYLSRLESVAETLRATLNEIAKTAPEWLLEQVSDEWFERYSRRIEDYRLPKSLEARNKYAEAVGADGFRLLQAIDDSLEKALKELPMVSLLRRQWEHQFEINEGQAQLIPANQLKPSGERFESPYDPESHFATKRTKDWRGYKVHFTEVCDDDCPHLITNVLTTSAVIPDTSVGKEIHDSLKNKKLLPTTHLVDLGYVDTKWIMESAEQDGIRVLGPARQNYQWQVKSKTGFALADFSIDWENKQVTCPTGQTAKNWAAWNYQGKEKIRVRFKPSQCQKCPQKELCTRSKLRRAVMFPKREEYGVLEAARIEETTVEWQQQYNRRAGIEGTFSQAVRGYGLRRTRYHGEQKTHLHNLATASAINVVKSVAWLDEKKREQTRLSRFAKLKLKEH